MGFDLGVSWLGFWLTQFEAVIRYLGFSLWPTPLVFDYGNVVEATWLLIRVVTEEFDQRNLKGVPRQKKDVGESGSLRRRACLAVASGGVKGGETFEALRVLPVQSAQAMVTAEVNLPGGGPGRGGTVIVQLPARSRSQWARSRSVERRCDGIGLKSRVATGIGSASPQQERAPLRPRRSHSFVKVPRRGPQRCHRARFALACTMVLRGWFIFIAGMLAARAAEWSIPLEEALAPPTAARLGEISEVVTGAGWGVVEAGARTAALDAYAANRMDSAEAWLLVSRWARLLGENQRSFVSRWIDAVNAARVGHPNMEERYTPPDAPLSALINPQLGAWLFAHRDFSRMFFETLAPVDYLPAALKLLDRLHRADPRRFERYASLALALALVHDVPPPPHWPHAQVGPHVLARTLLPAETAFAYWSQGDERGEMPHRLHRLSVGELKFLVDSPAPLPELVWARQSVKFPLEQFGATYDAVRYRQDRVDANLTSWPGRAYTLPAIYAEGGICVDQAYFATQAGKARGVPTLIFRGAGMDGRHAWFGYLGAGERWEMDAGRHAEQRYVSGYAFDPQTWANISDHEISFLAEGFRRLPTYRQSRQHRWMAEEYLLLGRLDEAKAAARKAVNIERRHLAAWELLLAIHAREGDEPRAREGVLREAALAFQRYPDLNVSFLKRVAGALRERGAISAAEQEERMLARKYESSRSDLTVAQAAEALERAVKSAPLSEQVRVYNLNLDQYGRGAGMEYFDRVVAPFVKHLMARGETGEARRAMERARAVLAVEPGRQLDREMAEFAARIR